MPHFWKEFLASATGFLLLGRAATFAPNPAFHHLSGMNSTSAETPLSREYFYVGGKYVDDGKGVDEHIFAGQMYVEKLTSTVSCQKPHPLVFIHGQGQTGTNWLNKPDGSPGWASYFGSIGYTVYILDQTCRGRSAWKPDSGNMSTYSAEIIQQRFTAPEKYQLWPQAALHTQWPGEGVMGDPYFDAYYASNVQFLASTTEQQKSVQAAGAELLDKIGTPVIFVAHSQGGFMSWLIADVRPDLTKAIVSMEPSGPPFRDAVFGNKSARPYGLTDVPITYDPPITSVETDLVKQEVTAPKTMNVPCILQADDPTPRQLVNLKDIPVLLVTAEASYHAEYDWCTVQYLQQAGVNVTHLELAEKGIRGNGHLFFLEKNSDEIAGVIDEWMTNMFKPCREGPSNCGQVVGSCVERCSHHTMTAGSA
jgi:pimeloyl-ACP methyl ester carboxylesterase